MRIDLHQVDAFTTVLFGGNPAGVVSNADGLSEKQMRAIAREMNLSETAFVLKPTVADADVKLRFFTPDGSEIKFCGHATVGTLHQLARLGLYGLEGKKSQSIRVETNADTLEMAVSRNKDGGPSISFTAPSVAMEPYRLQDEDFARTFDIPRDTLLQNGTIYIDTTLNYLYIPTRSLQTLGDARFNFDHIRTAFDRENIIVFCLFTNETVKTGYDLHARGLAPLVGVDEDPFTGSSMAGLVHATKLNKVIKPEQKAIKVEQGDFIGRPGQAHIHHNTHTNEIIVTAQAVEVFSTQMEV